MNELQLIESGKIMQAEDFILFAALDHTFIEDFLWPGIAHLFQGENGDRHPATLRFDGEPVPFSQGLAVRFHVWFGWYGQGRIFRMTALGAIRKENRDWLKPAQRIGLCLSLFFVPDDVIKPGLTADFLLPGIAHLFQGENGDRHPPTLRFDGELVPFSQGLAVRFHVWFGWFGIRRKWCCEVFSSWTIQPFHGCRHYICINGRKPMTIRRFWGFGPRAKGLTFFSPGQRPGDSLPREKLLAA